MQAMSASPSVAIASCSSPLVGAVDTDPVRLAAFCDGHKIPKRFESLDAALQWGAFDAVTNVTPDAAHYETTLHALRMILGGVFDRPGCPG